MISVAGFVLSKISLIIVTGATLIVTECCSKTEINEISEVKSGNYEAHNLPTTRMGSFSFVDKMGFRGEGDTH